MRHNRSRQRRQVTIRDIYVTAKALAYAVVTIERLPAERQEWSDMQNMKSLLDHFRGIYGGLIDEAVDTAHRNATGIGWPPGTANRDVLIAPLKG